MLREPPQLMSQVAISSILFSYLPGNNEFLLDFLNISRTNNLGDNGTTCYSCVIRKSSDETIYMQFRNKP